MGNSIMGNKALVSTIYLRYEEFIDDVLPALRCSDFNLQNPRIEDDTLYIKWDWGRIGTTISREIQWEDGESPETFDDKLQAYFFRLVISIINL